MRSGPVILAVVAAVTLAACGTATVRATQDSGEAHERATAVAPRSPDQARYTLDLAYDARRFTLSGTETIAFRNASAAPLTSVWLRVWANAFGGCRVNRAHVTIRAGGSLGGLRKHATDRGRRGACLPLGEAQQREAGLRLAATLARLSVRVLGRREVSAEPVQVALEVAGLAGGTLVFPQ